MRVLGRLRRQSDDGFTLIELLVVMVIIGVLAGIAIPSFLQQREKGYQAAEKNDLRTYSIALESYATDSGGQYTPSRAQAVADGYVASSAVVVAAAVYNLAPGTNNAYCLQASSSNTGALWYLDSATGTVAKGAGPNCTAVVTP
jgi:type IV pilus assembly protein PilA